MENVLTLFAIFTTIAVEDLKTKLFTLLTVVTIAIINVVTTKIKKAINKSNLSDKDKENINKAIDDLTEDLKEVDSDEGDWWIDYDSGERY